MARPILFPEWANDTVNEVVSIGGNSILVTNKVEPTVEFKNSGELARERLPRPYINFQFNLIDEWVKHLDERYAIGDFHMGANSETATTIDARLGGTWADRGTDTIAGQTIRLFEKVG